MKKILFGLSVLLIGNLTQPSYANTCEEKCKGKLAIVCKKKCKECERKCHNKHGTSTPPRNFNYQAEQKEISRTKCLNKCYEPKK